MGTNHQFGTMKEDGRKARILIVTSGPACRNPRAFKEATALAAADYDVTLLTIFETESDSSEDSRLLAATSVRRIELRSGRGLKSLFSRLGTWCARKAVRFTPWSPPASLGPAGRLLEASRQVAADLTIVHTEIAFWVGSFLLAEGRLVAADFEDWHSEDLLPEAQKSRPIKLIRRLEAEMLRKACYSSTTSEAMAGELALAYSAPRPFVLSNSFPLQAAVGPRWAREPEMVWFSQTIGPGRGLEEFLAAWAKTKPLVGRLTLFGRPIPGYEDDLLAGLDDAFRSRISVAGPVPPDSLPGRLQEFDLGLALEPRHPRNKDLTISNKILQYLNAGLAVISTPTKGQLEVLGNAPGAGHGLDFQAGEASAELGRILGDAAGLRAAQAAARKAAEGCYCWEKEAPKLQSLVSRSLEGSR